MKKLILAIIIAFCTLPASARLKVGVVFGGGGAKGAAEVGVLKYIIQSGIPVDYVAGTSIGGIVGGLYSCGVTPEEMQELFLSQQWLDLFTDCNKQFSNQPFARSGGKTYIFGIPLGNDIMNLRMPTGLLKGDSITSLLNHVAPVNGNVNFDRLPIPFRCIAADSQTLDEIVLSSGDLATNLRATMSIPILFTPINMNGRELVDGGLVNNLPCDIVRQMGADVVIAIDLSEDSSSSTPDLTRTLLQMLFGNADFAGGLFHWYVSRPDIARYEQNIKLADVRIIPDLHEFSFASFSRSSIETMIQRGEQAGRQALPHLLKIRQRIYAD